MPATFGLIKKTLNFLIYLPTCLLTGTPTKSLVNNKMSPTGSGEQTWSDRQFVVIASDKVARVVALPSHNCVYKQIITEVSFVVKAEIIQMKG